MARHKYLWKALLMIYLLISKAVYGMILSLINVDKRPGDSQFWRENEQQK